ncbi:sulfatase-like hydrolase/transferase [Roseimaritima sediminicola]|uniref:sulfatase-like hydrolase/transferase n=1 Tax=Roseimaritima sediminicola TaxID=2662066 RepID=UPI0012985822|nr:sulfatase-like hydrolase/transferase [Roseimaritima sediminicola]
MLRFRYLLLLLGLIGSLQSPLLAAPADDATDNDQPNIMVFLVDDMGVMDTSVAFLTDAAGEAKRYPLNDYYRTPNMQRLADRGIRFNNFCAMSVCSPTRISIMTGQNAARHRATNWINPYRDNRGPLGPPDWDWQGLDSGDVTLPRVLGAAGYRTIHVGKAHFGPEESEGADPENLGFDINVAGASFGAPASYYGTKNYGNGRKKARHAVPDLEKYHGSETFLTEALTIEAKRHVKQAVEDDQPFFLHMSHYAVHAPFHSDPRFAANYRDSDKSAKAQAFATLIEGMDKSLGDLLDHLDELDVAENTLVIFLGDNGSDAPLGHQHAVASSAPLRGKKGSHYEGGMRVPFIAAWARPEASSPVQQRLPIAQGTIQSQIASVEDLYPTLVALAGAEQEDGAEDDRPIVDGQRLDTLLSGEADDSRHQSFLMHYPHAPHRSDYFTSYREGDWKVVYHYFPSQTPEVSAGSHYQLFHLSEDPFEQNNLAESRPEVLRRMMQALSKSLKAHDAVYPIASQDDPTPVFPEVP